MKTVSREEATKVLQSYTKEMDVPENRQTDFHWLSRNLFIRNGDHKNFMPAMRIIKQLCSPGSYINV